MVTGRRKQAGELMRPPVQVGPGKKVKPSECANCGKPTHCPDPATGNGIGCCYGTTAQDHWDKATKIAQKIVEGQQESIDDLARTVDAWNGEGFAPLTAEEMKQIEEMGPLDPVKLPPESIAMARDWADKTIPRDAFYNVRTDGAVWDVLRLYADPKNWGDTNQHSKGTRWTGGGLGRGPAARLLKKLEG